MHVFALLFSAFPTLHNLPQKYSHPLPNLLIFFFYYYYYYCCCCCCYDYDRCDCDYYPPTHPSVPLLSRSETSPRTNAHTPPRTPCAALRSLRGPRTAGRIRRASTIAFTDGASTAAFNDDLKTLSKSLEFMTATLEGMLSEELRPAFVTCDEDNLVRFAAINRRIAVLTQQLESAAQHRAAQVHRRRAHRRVAPHRARHFALRVAAVEPVRRGRGHALSPVSPSTLFGSRDAKVGVEVGTGDPRGARVVAVGERKPGVGGGRGWRGSGGRSGDADNHDSPGKPKKKQRLQMVRKAWHSLTHKNFFPPRVMPVGEKYIKEKFEEMDQVRAFFFFYPPLLSFFLRCPLTNSLEINYQRDNKTQDSSGELDRSEVEAMLKSEGLSDKEVKIIVDKFDVDGTASCRGWSSAAPSCTPTSGLGGSGSGR